MKSVILGCGDVGRRIVKVLRSNGNAPNDIFAYVNSKNSLQAAAELGVSGDMINLDSLQNDLASCDKADVYYTIAPQKSGETDARTQAVLAKFEQCKLRPHKVVLISTTGVYGDCEGAWVDETSSTQPMTDRAKRRLDSEKQWLSWGASRAIDIVVLRVPGIYAFSRIPRERLKRRTPIVRAGECGYTNRIHADDLAQICVIAMMRAKSGEIFNATDGTPGKVSEYLSEAAKVIGVDPLPEISMQQAFNELSSGMLSYLGESRKISNKKMLKDLEVTLQYPDFKQGLLV